MLSSRICDIVAYATRLRDYRQFSLRRDGEHFGKIISITVQAEYTSPMKSAFELAMSRLEKESPTQKLTDEQKVETCGN